MSGGAFCGPTNALASLQKHGTADRTLQQDRIRAAQAGPSAPQGFRGPHAVSSNINHEFEQFSAATPDFLHKRPVSWLPNWAAEFQQLHLSSPPPPLAGLQHTIPRGTWASPVSSPVPTTSSPWHTEFLSQPSQPATVYSPVPQRQLLHQQPLVQHQPLQQQQPALDPLPELRTHSPSDVTTNFHDSDTFYAHVYDSEAYPTFPYLSSSTTAEKTAMDMAFDNAFADVQRLYPESSQYSILDDSFDEQSMEGNDKGRIVEEADELSRTAGQLLETLATEQSRKFRESNFLALMRKLRDKEVIVEGGEMVEVRGPS